MSAAAVAVASSFATGAATPVNLAPPPIVINLSVAPHVSPHLVSSIVAEADAIFRSAGVTFIWRRAAPALTTLSVTIGGAAGASRSGTMPLGWIEFVDGRPEQEIYISYTNAERFMDESRGVVGLVNNMPRVERDTMLARVMGRALAHELGHYLLGTKTHTARGLLKAVRTAQEFFAPDRQRFQLDPAQRQQIAAHLHGGALIAER